MFRCVMVSPTMSWMKQQVVHSVYYSISLLRVCVSVRIYVSQVPVPIIIIIIIFVVITSYLNHPRLLR
jgi:hypothetical protein